MLEMCPDCDVKKIPRSGPAPVLLRPHELAMIGPDWETYTAWIEGNENAKKVLGAHLSMDGKPAREGSQHMSGASCTCN